MARFVGDQDHRPHPPAATGLATRPACHVLKVAERTRRLGADVRRSFEHQRQSHSAEVGLFARGLIDHGQQDVRMRDETKSAG
ncbi:hypothetical protein Q2941_50965, partial [Bradyrhizobium sp. UFLA05-153]